MIGELNIMDAAYSHTDGHINLSKEPAPSGGGGGGKKGPSIANILLTTFSILLIITACIIVGSVIMRASDEIAGSQPKEGISIGNIINLTVNNSDGVLKGEVNNIAVALKDRIYEDSTVIKDDELRTVDTYDGVAYITYIKGLREEDSSQASAYEYVTSRNPIDLGEITEQIRKSYGTKYFSHLSLSDERGEIVKGLERQGFVYLAEFRYGDTLKKGGYNPKDLMAERISNSIYDKSGTEVKTTLNLEGLGDLNLNNLSFLKGEPEFSFSNENHIAKVYDSENDEAVLFISNINNQNLANDSRKLVEIPGWNNVYLDLGWHHANDFGFGSFGIQTEVGSYYFKIGETVEDKESAMKELLDTFGIKADDPKIDGDIQPIFTIDNLFERLTLDEAKALLESDDSIGKGIGE